MHGSGSTELPPYICLKGISDAPVISLDGGNISTAVWYLSSDKAAELKSVVEKVASTRISINDALSALIWRHISQARRLQPSEHPTTCDFKHRIQPNLPPAFVGNSGYCVLAVSSMPEPVSSTSIENLAHLAEVIRASVESLDNDAVNQITGGLNAMSNMADVTWATNWPMQDTGGVRWTRFNYATLDWGRYMKCDGVRSAGNYYSGMSVFAPALDKGSLEIFTSLDT
jgi:hypothetical protein